MNPTEFAINLLARNKNVANSPLGTQFLHILQTGDEKAGIAMAQNIYHRTSKVTFLTGF